MICEYCNKDKPKDRFEICKRTDEKVYRRNKCRDCREQDKRDRKERIREKIREFREDSECAHCGFEDHRALDFHHDEDNKSFTIGDALSKGRSWKTIKEEIEKCEVLCANCHRVEHYT